MERVKRNFLIELRHCISISLKNLYKALVPIQKNAGDVFCSVILFGNINILAS